MSSLAEFRPHIDRASLTPLARQLCDALKEAIIGGLMASEERLPATRSASRDWKLSRSAVVEAYEILILEGYAVARHGSGTYIAPDLPRDRTHRQELHVLTAPSKSRRISDAAIRVLKSKVHKQPSGALPFCLNRVSEDDNTASLWKRIGKRHMEYALDGRGDVQGTPELRGALSDYLRISRGVRCTADQVFVTAGPQQALDLAFRALVSPGDTVFIGDPSYPSSFHSLNFIGAKVISRPVDETGLMMKGVVEHLQRRLRLLYVTPSSQFPLGTPLSLQHRYELLKFARNNGCWIVEDDVDGEFYYEGHHTASLQNLDRSGRVLYAGSFSKIFSPQLGLGYLVVPPDLVAIFKAVSVAIDRCLVAHQQRVIADFLNEGHLPNHLRRLRKRLRTSRDLLANALKDRTGDHLTITLPTRGTHVIARSTGTWKTDTVVAAHAFQNGVIVTPLSSMNNRSVAKSGLLLGFSGLSEQEAIAGADLLKKTFEAIAKP